METQLRSTQTVPTVAETQKTELPAKTAKQSKIRNTTAFLPAKSRNNPFVDVEFDVTQVGAFTLTKTFKVCIQTAKLTVLSNEMEAI